MHMIGTERDGVKIEIVWVTTNRNNRKGTIKFDLNPKVRRIDQVGLEEKGGPMDRYDREGDRAKIESHQ